jgi:anti-anti-sigma factor
MEVKLVAVEGEWRDQQYPVEAGDFVIGRAAGCQVQIDHSLVDLEHCRLRIDGDRLVLEDLGSSFGTSVNGRRVQTAELQDGDRFRIGPSSFLVSISGAAGDRPRPATHAEALGGDEPEQVTRSRGRAPDEDTPAMESARQIYDRLVSNRRELTASAGGPSPSDTEEGTDTGPRSRLKVVKEEHGISVVNVMDRSIINDDEIQQIGHELDELLQQGRSRIVLDFGNVKHMSSQAVGVLLQAQKRAKSGGGLLKLCSPNPTVAEVFKITNLLRAIEIHPDQQHAFQTGWPEALARPSAKSASAPNPSTATNEPPTDEMPIPIPPQAVAAALRAAAAGSVLGSGQVTGPVRLILENGKGKGKAIKISGPTFVIGRDPQCQLRPASTAVSRTHTRIEVRDGRVFVRDLGTTNGTLLAHRLLRGTEAEAHNGDLLQIGPLLFRVVWERLGASDAPPADPGEDATSSWLLQGPAPNLADTALFPLQAAGDAFEDARKKALAEVHHLKWVVSGDVLVVSVLAQEMRDEDQVAPIRHELMTLMEQPVPKNVVLRLDRVNFLSSSAIGMLLAHHQRLARAGGGLRFAGVRPTVRPALEHQRVSMLVELFDSADEAVREPWPISDGP